jgi:hypothetical protein|tara:strand:+ start:289 stop:756 length:468 start_codon:yes stop_codon:yes gene_type:complete
MNFSKKIFFIILLSVMSVNVFADDHSDNSELVEKAKKITEEIANKNQIDEDEVPLNDPFAGNEGMSSSTVNPETGEERDEMSLYNFKLSGLISGKDESYITLTNTSGDVITLNLNQYLGKIKFVDLRLTEAIFEKDDKTYIIIDFNNQIRESDEY